MQYQPDRPFHIFNQGTNRKRIFTQPSHYLYFLEKVKKSWAPLADILGYTLLPTKFHFLIIPSTEACIQLTQKELLTHLQKMSHTIGTTLSSYAKGFNRSTAQRGVVFEKKTRCIPVGSKNGAVDNHLLQEYITMIEEKPVRAGLVANTADWPYSSVRDPVGLIQRASCS